MKYFAQSISVIFHPLLISLYVLLACLVINPYLFGVQDTKSKGVIIISVFLLSVFFPVLSILMMKSLGLIHSLEMKDTKERIGPMIATAVFYLWLYVNIKDNTVIPGAYSFFVLGATIGLFLAFFINTFQKISLHGVGMGGLLVAMLIIGDRFSYGSFLIQLGEQHIYHINIIMVYMVVIMIVGITLSSRLFLNAHSREEIYGGLLVGSASQLIAYMWFF